MSHGALPYAAMVEDVTQFMDPCFEYHTRNDIPYLRMVGVVKKDERGGEACGKDARLVQPCP